MFSESRWVPKGNSQNQRNIFYKLLNFANNLLSLLIANATKVLVFIDILAFVAAICSYATQSAIATIVAFDANG